MEIKRVFEEGKIGDKIEVSGWIKTRRDSQKLSFAVLNDGTCFKDLQVTFRGFESKELENIQTGASIRIEGELKHSLGSEQSFELDAKVFEILGEAGSDYPLQKKRHNLEFLREIAHLRPKSNTFLAVTRLRNNAAMAIHKFFQERGFLWISTPIISSMDGEGSGSMFQVTTLDLEQGGKVNYKDDFFKKKVYLTVTGQLNVECYAQAFSKVYTFGPTFRAENSNTYRHAAEFWMVEPEIAFCTKENCMDIASEFIIEVIKSVLQSSPDEMNFFEERVEPGKLDTLHKLINSKFEKISYTDAIKELEKVNDKFEFKVKWGMDLQSEHERYLTQEIFSSPVIVSDYPKDIKAFYMKLNDDGKTVRGFDVLVPQIGEIIGGSERENRYDVLKQKIRDFGLQEENYNWYTDLRKYGSVEHSGFGLGFERLLMYITGMKNIRDVIPFPRNVGNINY